MDGHEKPAVAAVFLVVFDQRVGYTFAWKRSVDDVDLDGVEYKSLPSGLHAVKEDLVYFIHGEYAGISLFVQDGADVRHRNASFAAVGALVPLSHGQLGRSWAHADELRTLAKEAVKNTSDHTALELFWKQHNLDNTSKKYQSSTSAGPDKTGVDDATKRKRATSEASWAGCTASGAWPMDHPALHAPLMLETFGPLLFPIHRAALLRQRILFSGSPSVQQNANIVYLTSVLSTITQSFRESLPVEAEAIFRTIPLFSIGIHDIPFLTSRRGEKAGWLATTTDSILGDKRDLYDLLVELPSLPGGKAWPKLKTADGKVVKASLRDQQRWSLLKSELRRLRRQTVSRFAEEYPSTGEDDQRPLLERQTTSKDDIDGTSLQNRDESEAVEPPSWSALAYRGFMWWASAGDVSAWEHEQARSDEELLFDMPDIGGISPGMSGERTQDDKESEYARAVATFLVAYFRRVTEGILRPLVSIVEAADDDTEEGVQEDEIMLSGDDVRLMGLDSWSELDKLFVRDMMKTWFGREAVVADNGVRVCGVRVC